MTLTLAEVAKIYGTGVRRVREAIARGELPTTQLGGKVFVLRGAVEDRLGSRIELPDDDRKQRRNRRAPETPIAQNA
jgi:excisionase family DNA binding protein